MCEEETQFVELSPSAIEYLGNKFSHEIYDLMNKQFGPDSDWEDKELIAGRGAIKWEDEMDIIGLALDHFLYTIMLTRLKYDKLDALGASIIIHKQTAGMFMPFNPEHQSLARIREEK